MINSIFSTESLIQVYKKAKKGKLSTGRDRINKSNFDKKHQIVLENVSKKIQNYSYQPTAYKEVLILKNKHSTPRKLSIPTIRDNIIIDVIKNQLNNSFKPIIAERKVPDLINKVNKVILSHQYDSFIKIDISKYYDNINHDILLKKVHSLINDNDFISLIDKLIKNPTLNDEESSKSICDLNSTGVPQGIAISNILGNIYLNDFDRQYYEDKNIEYVRYVDDILLFCKDKDIVKYKNSITEKLCDYKLNINEEKYHSGKIEEFDFLGYKFYNDGTTSIADKNVRRMELSLEKIFSDYISSHDKRIKGNIDLLKWKIDFKITGCFKGGRRYGWVIFFCQNQDETILHELDWLVRKLCLRFNLQSDLLKNNYYTGKRFVKTHKEFVSKKDNTTYIPNVDKYAKVEKQKILINVCHRKRDWVYGLNDYMLEKEFERFIFKSIKDIEHDLYQIYT